jgi:hypothetical protein
MQHMMQQRPVMINCYRFANAAVVRIGLSMCTDVKACALQGNRSNAVYVAVLQACVYAEVVLCNILLTS